MTPTIKGQYRRVRYTDDGCTIYQCLWCMNRIEIRDDPVFWCFCPKCGKSWFTRLECRDHDTPAWAWNRYGSYDCEHPTYYTHHKDEYWWIIEERTKWPNSEWSGWHHETCCRVEFGTVGAWRIAQQQLNMCRASVALTEGIEFQYRAILRKINVTK